MHRVRSDIASCRVFLFKSSPPPAACPTILEQGLGSGGVPPVILMLQAIILLDKVKCPTHIQIPRGRNHLANGGLEGDFECEIGIYGFEVLD